MAVQNGLAAAKLPALRRKERRSNKVCVFNMNKTKKCSSRQDADVKGLRI
jgi:hypothetical protein